MPTIEIVSINALALNLNEKEFKIAIIEETKLESHRSLFYEFLNKQKGVIVHIGNPDFKNYTEGPFLGNLLIDWDFEDATVHIPEVDINSTIIDTGANQLFGFKFLSEYKSDINKILEKALDNSPIKQVFFLTDIQFGPQKANKEIIYTLDDFWKRHDNEGLVFNTLYELYGR